MAIEVTDRQRGILEEMARSYRHARSDVIRAGIILAAAAGGRNQPIAEELGVHVEVVSRWRGRWAAAFARLVELEETEDGKVVQRKLRRAIEEVLRDAPRSGRQPTFEAEQLTVLIAVACTPPKEHGRPISHWTPRELADEMVKQGVFESISPRHVARILDEAKIKPHQWRYWLNNDRAKDPEAFDRQAEAVCRTYGDAPALREDGGHTISVDEKSGMQALGRTAPTKDVIPGEVERREFEYARHGTLALIANFDVATGRVETPSIGPTRTEQDFLDHVEGTVDTDPEAVWVFVADRLNTHRSASLVRWVAGRCGIELDLGTKGKDGVLKSMVTRTAFLEDPEHRIRFVFTPKHASWLNQVEIWFSILARRLLRRGSFQSTEDLRERVLAFIEYFNRTMAKPFKWTYTGRPLAA